MERDVMTALADADIDDMWERADRANRVAATNRQTYIENGDSIFEKKRSVSGVKDNEGNFIMTTTDQEGNTEVNKTQLRRDRSYSNQMVNEMSQQMHEAMDLFVDFDLTVMDSILLERLADRHLYPDFVAVDVINSNNEILKPNNRIMEREFKNGYDVFSLCFNPESDMYYRVYMTPLTGTILSQMSGVIVTILLLMVAFSWAFWYLTHTVSRLRTIEEMKDDFVSNMTHELKTPIAIAYSANDALLNYDVDNNPEKRKKYLMIANKQLRQLGLLVENILVISMERRKTITLKQEEISLLSVLEEIAAAQRLRRDKEINIKLDIDHNLRIRTDRTHFSNLMNNLIDNAIKYSGANVEIQINGNEKELSVKDNGIGIPLKSIPFIFNKFYRVPHGNRQDVRGYGIGLYYVKSVVDKMGWNIEVKSKEGEGSVFTIYFK